MTLTSGTKLGTYEITSHIGSGGMGEVYQAHDSKLGRDVAIKVLPEQFALDPERLARFQREAKMLAALNHPNIAAIYGLEQSGSMHYLVMELVPGETLRERVAGGPVPVEEALTIAKQIAEALEAAHNSEKGIIHRDLKPANVKVTPEGRVKVLDFGLAKAFTADPSATDIGNSPTLSMAATVQGVIMGTAAYMSPEQARGKHVDKRTDIWAFGCVLYELITGKQVFRGEDVTEIIAAVLKSEPDWTALPPETPANVHFVLRRCLEKDRNRRLRDAADVQIQLEDTPAVPLVALSASSAAAPAKVAEWKRVFSWTVAVLSLAVGLGVWSLRPATIPQPISRVVIPLAVNERLSGSTWPMVAFSPDGTQLAYIASGAGAQQHLYLRALDSMEARQIAGTEGASDPFFSPDGQWIGFFASGKLKKISVTGGAVLNLCNAPTPRGASWGANDIIVFAPTNTAGLSQVSAAGGEPQVLTKRKENEGAHRWPHFLPDGKTILYATGTAGTNFDDAEIMARRLDTNEEHVVIQGGTFPYYVPTGHLVYYHAGVLMGVPFDLARLQVTGLAVPVVEGVMSSSQATGSAQFSISRSGSLAYIPGGPERPESKLVWVDRKGVETPLPAPPRNYDDPRLSPNGQQVATQVVDGSSAAVWIYDILRATLTRLTFDGLADVPLWSSDGRRIIYSLAKQGANGLYWKSADGSGAEERLSSTDAVSQASSISPDGQTLAYYVPASNTGNDIWVLAMQGDRKARPFLRTVFVETAPMFSPDGRWLAYTSNESGRNEIYVQPFPGPGGKWLISTAGGTEPVWARNGKELFYRDGEKMMAVDIQSQPTFNAGTPHMLFERPGYPAGTSRADYDVSLDGQRFLMLKGSTRQETALTQVNVVLNWSEELKRRMPTGTK